MFIMLHFVSLIMVLWTISMCVISEEKCDEGCWYAYNNTESRSTSQKTLWKKNQGDPKDVAGVISIHGHVNPGCKVTDVLIKLIFGRTTIQLKANRRIIIKRRKTKLYYTNPIKLNDSLARRTIVIDNVKNEIHYNQKLMKFYQNLSGNWTRAEPKVVLDLLQNPSKIENESSCITYKYISVCPKQIPLICEPGNVTILTKIGNPEKMRCVAQGPPPLSLHWTKAGSSYVIKHTTSYGHDIESILRTENFTQEDIGQYKCTVKNSAGEVTKVFDIKMKEDEKKKKTKHKIEIIIGLVLAIILIAATIILIFQRRNKILRRKQTVETRNTTNSSTACQKPNHYTNNKIFLNPQTDQDGPKVLDDERIYATLDDNGTECVYENIQPTASVTRGGGESGPRHAGESATRGGGATESHCSVDICDADVENYVLQHHYDDIKEELVVYSTLGDGGEEEYATLSEQQFDPYLVPDVEVDVMVDKDIEPLYETNIMVDAVVDMRVDASLEPLYETNLVVDAGVDVTVDVNI